MSLTTWFGIPRERPNIVEKPRNTALSSALVHPASPVADPGCVELREHHDAFRILGGPLSVPRFALSTSVSVTKPSFIICHIQAVSCPRSTRRRRRAQPEAQPTLRHRPSDLRWKITVRPGSAKPDVEPDKSSKAPSAFLLEDLVRIWKWNTHHPTTTKTNVGR